MISAGILEKELTQVDARKCSSVTRSYSIVNQKKAAAKNLSEQI